MIILICRLNKYCLGICSYVLRPLTISTAASGFTFLHCLKVVIISTATAVDELLTLLRALVVEVTTEVG